MVTFKSVQSTNSADNCDWSSCNAACSHTAVLANTTSRYEDGLLLNYILGRTLVASWDKLVLGGARGSANSTELGSTS